MFPLRPMRKPQRTPYVTYSLIVVNVLIFLWQTTLSRASLGELYLTSALIPCEASRSLLSPETWLDAFRTMFLHGGWVHIIGNMVFLSIFGPLVEDYFGKVKYLLFYLAVGYAAGFIHTAVNWNICVPTIGASGAIYGLMGGFFLLYPATRITTVAFFWRVPVGTINVQAFYMLLYYFLLDFINGIASLSVDDAATGGVALWAHVGGFVAGLLLTFVAIIFKDPPVVDPLEYLNE